MPKNIDENVVLKILEACLHEINLMLASIWRMKKRARKIMLFVHLVSWII